MTVPELIRDLESIGVRLWVDEENLRFRAPAGVLTAEHRTLLAEHRAEVMDYLRTQADITVQADPAGRHDPFPVTDVQAAYLIGRRDVYGYGALACHIYLELEFTELDPSRLQNAWRALISRHDALRTVFTEQGNQRVLDEVPNYEIEVDDLRGNSDSVASVLEQTRGLLSHRVYDAGRWPLFELRVTRTDENDILHFSMDFLVADWASIEILLSELDVLHQNPEHQLPELEISFRDYVLTERRLRDTPQYERDRRYWLDRLDELPAAPELPLLPSTGEPSEAATAGPRFQRKQLRLPKTEWAALRAHAAQRSVTPSAAVLAAYAEVIARWSRQPRFTVNLTMLNRLPLHPDVNRVVGDFTSVNLLDVDAAPSSSFGDRAKSLTGRLFSDLDHRLFSGVEVIRELARRRGRAAAQMPIVFTSALGVDEGTAGDIVGGAFGRGITQTPQVWIDCQAIERAGVLWVNWDVREGVLPAQVVDDMHTAFETLLNRLAGDASAWQETSPVGLPEDQAERRKRVNDTSAPLPDGLLHEGVFGHAATHPQDVALLSATDKLTFGDLAAWANGVAATLVGNGIGSGDRVAVLAEKSCDQIAAVLGVARSGAAYVPIDVHQPAPRRDGMLADAGVRYVLTRGWLAETGDWPDSVTPLVIENYRDSVAAPVEPVRPAAPDDLAYITYTSGSSGRPKGVMITHRSALNTIVDINVRFGVSAEDRVLGLAELGFDLSVYDVFGVLTTGAQLVLPDPTRRSDPSHWGELVDEHRITLWNSVPAQLGMLMSYGDADLGSLRLAMLSGDWIPVTLPDAVSARVPDVQLISLGGATEASIWSIFHPITEQSTRGTSIPYGRPLANQTFHVLDEWMRPVPDWTTGELYIGGVGVAQGYAGDAKRTAQRFVPDPSTGGHLYRTGDLGRYLDNGDIEFLGREDLQVKIRGHRIELQEVETALLELDDVVAAAVVAWEAQRTALKLTGFVELVGEDRGRAEEIASLLRRHLPEHMVPAHLEVLESLPVTNNGKIDRESLVERASLQEIAQRPGGEEPHGDLERRIAAIWCAVLGLPSVGRHDDFFAGGGDSLLAAQLIGQLRDNVAEAGGLFFDSLMRALLPTPTVAALAAHLSADSTGVEEPAKRKHGTGRSLVELGGQPGGRPVVLVHGDDGTLDQWDDLLDFLSRDGSWVLGFVVDEPSAYLRSDPKTLWMKRAAGYAQILKAREIDGVEILGCGVSSRLAVELARQLTESGLEVVALTVVGDPEPAGAPEPGSIAEHTKNAGTVSISHYAGDLTAIVPAGTDVAFWHDICLGEVRVVDIPANRDDCLSGGNAELVAEALSERTQS